MLVKCVELYQNRTGRGPLGLAHDSIIGLYAAAAKCVTDDNAPHMPIQKIIRAIPLENTSPRTRLHKIRSAMSSANMPNSTGIIQAAK